MIQDQIFCDSTLSEKLQLESDLALEKAITLAHNRESVRKQQRVVRANTSSCIDAVGYSSKHKGAKTQKPLKPNSEGF